MGHEAVGEVVAVGSAVTKFKVGDMAISSFSLSCGKFPITQVGIHCTDQ